MRLKKKKKRQIQTHNLFVQKKKNKQTNKQKQKTSSSRRDIFIKPNFRSVINHTHDMTLGEKTRIINRKSPKT